MEKTLFTPHFESVADTELSMQEMAEVCMLASPEQTVCVSAEMQIHNLPFEEFLT